MKTLVTAALLCKLLTLSAFALGSGGHGPSNRFSVQKALKDVDDIWLLDDLKDVLKSYQGSRSTQICSSSNLKITPTLDIKEYPVTSVTLLRDERGEKTIVLSGLFGQVFLTFEDINFVGGASVPPARMFSFDDSTANTFTGEGNNLLFIFDIKGEKYRVEALYSCLLLSTKLTN